MGVRREDHLRQRAIGWTLLLGGVGGLLASIPLAFVIGVAAAFVATACTGAMLTGGTMIRHAREALKALPQIPTAKLLG